MYLLVICVSSFESCFFFFALAIFFIDIVLWELFVQFIQIIGLFVLLAFNFLSSLYILDINHLSYE
jgi:hypothetical protein